MKDRKGPPSLWWVIYCASWFLFLVFLVFFLCGCAQGADKKIQHTRRWDVYPQADTGYHYPKNRHSAVNLKGPNVDNRKCQKPHWYNHSKCCRRRKR